MRHAHSGEATRRGASNALRARLAGVLIVHELANINASAVVIALTDDVILADRGDKPLDCCSQPARIAGATPLASIVHIELLP